MSRPSSEAHVVRFGVFELDVHSGELRKAGARLKLSEQPLQILTALLQRPDQLVTREELRQRLWPSDTFVDFEHGLNAAVRRLRDVLGDSADRPRFIETVPRRGYRFVAPVSTSPPCAAALPTDAANVVSQEVHVRPVRVSLRTTIVGIAAAAVAIGAMSAFLLVRRGAISVAPPTLVPLTSLAGDEMRPALSPDGAQVAFFWGGERNDDGGVYVMIIGSPEIRRVTTSPNHDNFVNWSPDGRLIAFSRFSFAEYAGARIHTVSPLGGPDPRLSDFPARGPLSWSADGRYLAASRWARDDSGDATGIFLIPLDGGQPRPVTHARAPARDTAVAFSPDGRQVAYVSCAPECDLYVLALNTDLIPSGPPKRITTQKLPGIPGIAWARDGQSIVYSSPVARYITYLWRVDLNGRRPPERIELAGLNAFAPGTARSSSDRLVFSRYSGDADIYRLRADGSPEPVVASSFADYDPQFSPDGDRIVFASDRSGQASELWVADRAGTGAQRLIKGPGRWQSSPQWSPDGRRVAFESVGDDGVFHVWTVDARGGVPTRLTTRTGNERFPSWSRDAKRIYFSADNGSEWDIWRTSKTGETLERVTRTGNASRGFESADGKSFVYQARFAGPDRQRDPSENAPLLIVPTGGGDAVELAKCASAGSLSGGPTEFVFADCGWFNHEVPVLALNIVTGAQRVVVRHLDGCPVGCPMAVRPSSNNEEILYVRYKNFGVDLMLIENFQ